MSIVAGVSAAFAMGVGVERPDTPESPSADAPAAANRTCEFHGSLPAAEPPSWQFFEPGAHDGVLRKATTAHGVAKAFADLDYDPERIRDGERTIPRLILARMPTDIADVDPPDARKSLFIASLLPVALYVNEKMLVQRHALEILRACGEAGVPVGPRARAWLAALAEMYDEQPHVDRLLLRVDVVPPSLVLAQAAVESGWGTSRLAQEANALFGEFIYRRTPRRARGGGPAGRMEPREFASVAESVLSYVRNLNTHAAYEGFRQRRATLRAAGYEPFGPALVGELRSYSTRRLGYVREIRNIMKVNRLDVFDDARLSEHPARLDTALD